MGIALHVRFFKNLAQAIVFRFDNRRTRNPPKIIAYTDANKMMLQR